MKQSEMTGLTVDETDGIGSWSSGAAPERKLLAAVLERAVLDLMCDDKEVVTMSEEWFNESFVDNPEVFTFQYVCFMLDLDAVTIRLKAYGYREKKKMR
jgi:hypothetical protein